MLNTVCSDSLDLDELFTHDKIDGFATNEVAMKTGYNLSQRFNETSDLDRSDRSSWENVSRRNVYDIWGTYREEGE